MTNPFGVVHRAAILISAVVLGFAASANANVLSWSGGGTSGFWNDAGNWGFVGTPGNGDSVVFPAPSSLVSTTNNIVGLSLALIHFAGNGGGYTLTGNAITLTGGIEATNTIGLNTISNAITLGADIQVDVGNNAFLYLAGSIQGSHGATKIGAGTLMYTGPAPVNNTYTGTTHVNAGLLQLNVGGVNAFAGPLVIGDGSGTGNPIVRLLQNSEMPDTQPVTVNLNGLLDLNNSSDAIRALTVQGAIVTSENGTLSLNGDLTSLGANVESQISGNLQFLGSNLHLVTVADGPFFRYLDLFANIISDGGGGLLFTNSAPSAAFALVEGTNTFTGPVIIDNLTVSVQTPSGLGTAAAGTTVGSHGELFMYNTSITNETLTMAAGATLYGQDNCVWNGPIVLNGNVTIGCYPPMATFTLNGVISGNGGFEKLDVGILQLFGPSGNTYTGDTFIQDGLCLLDKSVGTAIPGGTLTIGDHSGTNATVRDVNVGGNLGLSAGIVINEGGLLDLNNESEEVSPIALSGGTISTGPGQLQINGNVTTLASTNNATINGAIAFNGPLRTITVNHGYAPGGWDLMIPASVGDSGGGMQIVYGSSSTLLGDGVVRFMGTNTFTGPLTVGNEINASAEAPLALGTTAGGTFVNNGGTLFLYDTDITNETVTLAAGATLTGQGGPVWAGPIVLTGNATIYGFNFLGTFDVFGAISGSGNLTVVSDGEAVRFSGSLANTYSGTTTVASSGQFLSSTVLLLLNRSGPGNSIPGALVISSNCIVRDLQDYQINSPFKPVTVLDTGMLDVTNHNEWIGPLAIQGAQVTTTASGLLYLGGDITVSNSPVAISQISGNATVWNGTRTINCVGHYFSPDIRFPANLGGNLTSGLIKTGEGEASLSGNNSFPGSVTVNDGTLWAAANNALGNTSTPATVTNTGSLFLAGNVAVGLKPLILAGTGNGQGELLAGEGNTSWAGSVTLATNVSVDVYAGTTLELSGILSGPGSLTKIDTGNLLLDGALPNSFAGTTLVQQGTLTLSKTNCIAVPNTLTIGQGLDGANGDVVATVLNYQLPTNNTVTVSSSGLLDVSGSTSFNNSVGSLAGTGAVHIGNNTFTEGGDNSSTTYAGAISGNLSGGAFVEDWDRRMDVDRHEHVCRHHAGAGRPGVRGRFDALRQCLLHQRRIAGRQWHGGADRVQSRNIGSRNQRSGHPEHQQQRGEFEQQRHVCGGHPRHHGRQRLQPAQCDGRRGPAECNPAIEHADGRGDERAVHDHQQ